MTSETRSGVGAGGVFLAFLGGALAATAAVLLLAPHSGAETRARIGEAVGRTEEQVKRARLAAAAAAVAAREAFTEAMREGH
jgi:gas vesicle protein